MGLGFLSWLNPLKPIGAALGAASDAKAKNRGEKFGGQLDLEHLLMQRDQQNQDMSIAREQEGRSGATDAYRKLLATSHVLNPSAKPQLAGPYAVAPRQASDAEVSGAGALQGEVMKRLQGGNPIAPVLPRPVTANDAAFRVDPKLLDASTGESIMGWLGALLRGGDMKSAAPRAMY
jgi:hypothetical protein